MRLIDENSELECLSKWSLPRVRATRPARLSAELSDIRVDSKLSQTQLAHFLMLRAALSFRYISHFRSRQTRCCASKRLSTQTARRVSAAAALRVQTTPPG